MSIGTAPKANLVQNVFFMTLTEAPTSSRGLGLSRVHSLRRESPRIQVFLSHPLQPSFSFLWYFTILFKLKNQLVLLREDDNSVWW